MSGQKNLLYWLTKKTTLAKTSISGKRKMAFPIRKVKPESITLPAIPDLLKKLKVIIAAIIKIKTPQIYFFISSGRERGGKEKKRNFLSLEFCLFISFRFFFLDTSKNQLQLYSNISFLFSEAGTGRYQFTDNHIFF